MVRRRASLSLRVRLHRLIAAAAVPTTTGSRPVTLMFVAGAILAAVPLSSWLAAAIAAGTNEPIPGFLAGWMPMNPALGIALLIAGLALLVTDRRRGRSPEL